MTSNKSERNKTKEVVPQCQIVVFRWKHKAERGTSNVQLAESVPFDISRYITEVSFQKHMDGPSGQFQITLPNDRDWRRYIEKGSWCIIYMSNNGDLALPKSPGGAFFGEDTDNLECDYVDIPELVPQVSNVRCIGYIDTVRAQGSVGDEKGEFDISFVVSGRDFGVVYEETEIWHNQFAFDATMLKAINNKIQNKGIKTVDGLLELLHDLFYAPDKIVSEPLKNDSLSAAARQWLLPRNLFTALDMTPTGADTYFGNIPGIKNFRETKATYPVESPTALLNGVAWSRLKSHSIEPYHELFPELDDEGLPRLNFRVLPWRLTDDQKKFSDIFPTMAKFADEENGIVELENVDIFEWDLGEDNHTRYNLFWSTINSSMISIQTSTAMQGDTSSITGFPRLLQESIKRHGLRLLYSEVNANIVIGKEKANPDLIRQFNELAMEFWERSHEYESGTMSVMGNNDVRVGKCVHVEEGSQYNSDKYFYIEGYEDRFSVDDKGAAEWVQSLFLTRGIEKEVLENPDLVTDRQTSFDDAGEFTDRTGTER